VDISGYFRLLAQSSSPSTPAAGQSNLYPKTDGHLRFMNDAGVEATLSKGVTYASLYSGSTFTVSSLGVPSYLPIAGYTYGNATEAQSQIALAGPGYLKRARLNITANSTTGATTIAIRVNGVSVSSFTVGAGATGWQTGGTAVAYNDGDLVCISVTTSTAGSFTFKSIQLDAY